LHNYFEEMYNLLFKLKGIQQQLLELSYKKKNLAYKNDIEGLNEVVGQELKYLSELNSLEKKRQNVQEKLSKSLNIPEKEITLSFIIDRAGGKLKERFTILQKELNGLLKAQEEINKTNKTLLETHLEYTDAMLHVIVGSEDPLNNYYTEEGKAVEKEMKKSAGLFDKQV
jgi:hypothetical protein